MSEHHHAPPPKKKTSRQGHSKQQTMEAPGDFQMNSDFFGGVIKEHGVEIPVERFDFGYVENHAKDWKELRAMLEVLKTGKEGYYPDLMNAVERKMLELMPEKDKRLYIAMTTEPSYTEEQAAKSEIGNALDKLTSFDAELKAAKSSVAAGNVASTASGKDVFDKSASGKSNLPPVRGAVTTKIKVNPNLREETESKEKEVKARKIDSRQGTFKEYYDMWSKFDDEEATAELDMSDIANDMARAEADDLRKKEEEKRRNKHRVELDNLHLTFDLAAMSVQQRQVMARNEKDKGNECFRANELSQSIYHYSRSLHLEPTNAIVYANRALSYLKSKELDNAERDCDRAIQLDNGYMKAYSRRGMTRHKRGKYKEAIEDYEKALELEPGNKEVTKMLQDSKDKYVEVEGEAADVRVVQGKKKFSRIQIEEDDDDDAQDANGTVAANSPIIPNSPVNNTTGSVETVNVAKASTFKRVAIQEESDEEESQDIAAPASVAAAASTEGQVAPSTASPAPEELVDSAAKAAEEALRVNTSPEVTACAVKNHGTALLNAGRFQEALECFSHSLRLFPRQTAGYLNRAAAHIKLGKFADAEKDCTICLAVNGSNCNEETKAATYLRRGVVRKYLNKLREGRDDLTKALDFGFNVDEIKLEIAAIDSLEGVTSTAATIPVVPTPPIIEEKAAPKLPVSSSESVAPEATKKPVEAAPAPKPASDSKPSASVAAPIPVSVPVPAGTAEELKILGNNEFKVGKYEAALALYSAAVTKDPLMDTARLNKAAALLKLDRFAEAEAECSAVIKRNKRDVKALYRRGVALRGRGKYELAILDFEEVILNEPSNSKAKEEVRDTKALLKEREDAAAKLAMEKAALLAASTPVTASINAASSGAVAEGSLPSLGEAAAKNLESQNKALAAAERIKAKLLVKLPAYAPKTAAEFKRELYNLRKQPETFALYLHMLPLDKIQAFFSRGGMDADTLELSVASIRHHMTISEEKDFIVTLLTEYSKVKSFKTACMVLDNKCTVELREVLSSLSGVGVSEEAVSALKKAYGL